MTNRHDQFDASDRLAPDSQSQRSVRGTARVLLDQAVASHRGYVVTRRSAAEFQARAAALLARRADAGAYTKAPRIQLTIISDSADLSEARSLVPLDGRHVLVTASEQERRLCAVQLDKRGSGTRSLVAARTEAALAQLINAPGVGCDEAFMLGATELSLPAYAACEAAFLRRAGRVIGLVPSVADALIDRWGLDALARSVRTELVEGNEAGERALRYGLVELTQLWQRSAKLRTFGEAVTELLNWPILDSIELPMSPAQWRDFSCSRPLAELRERADVLDVLPKWDPDHACTSAGFYSVRGGIEYAITRSLAAAPHADLLWLAAPSADLAQARRFAEAVHARYPDKLLGYQLAPQAADALAKLGAGCVHDFANVLVAFGYSLHVMSEDSPCASLLGECVPLT